jgi:hypothetical protein
MGKFPYGKYPIMENLREKGKARPPLINSAIVLKY